MLVPVAGTTQLGLDNLRVREVSDILDCGARCQLLEKRERYARQTGTRCLLGATVSRSISTQTYVHYGTAGLITVHDKFPTATRQDIVAAVVLVLGTQEYDCLFALTEFCAARYSAHSSDFSARLAQLDVC